MKADGFARASTVHAELFRLKNGRAIWDKSTVVIVDEAAMLDTRVTRELLVEARRSGAKLILAGDDRQLASIERGGLFSELKQRHGSAEITEVTRQKVDWQRQAARDLAEGNFAEAVSAFAKNGAIHWTEKQDQAREALVERWRQDTARDPQATRFVFAYTNKDVNALNEDLRAARRERGELSGEDVRFETKHGAAMFAVGDRVQFTDTRKSAKIYNGNVGTITGLDARTGLLRAQLDGPQGAPGREVVWSASEFDGFRHGYAGTIYKGQGKTLDHTYLYHTEHWRQAASYVALTRQRESATIFVARETARNPKQLAWQMARGEVKSASLAWATRDELAPALRAKADAAEARAGRKADDGRGGEGGARVAERGGSDGGASEGRAGAARSTDGRRREEHRRPGPRAQRAARGKVAAASRARVADRAARVAGRARQSWARAGRAKRFGLRRERQGRSARAPGAFDLVANRLSRSERGRRRGSTRLLRATGSPAPRVASRAIRRSSATTPARPGCSPAPPRDRSGPTPCASRRRSGRGSRDSARRRLSTARDYRAGVEKQLQADATGIPKLSERAQVAIGAVRAAKTDKERAEAWKATTSDKAVAGELTAFAAAMEKRFGEDGVRAMVRADQPGAKAFEGGASVAPAERQAAAEAGRAMATVKSGERAVEKVAQAERVAERATQGARLKP